MQVEGSERQVTQFPPSPREPGSAERYQIGDLRLDVRHALVSRAGQPIPLSPLSFELLLALARRAPGVMRRQELLEAVWPEQFVGDEALSQRVKLLCQSLGDVGDKPQYVATVLGLGLQADTGRRAFEGGTTCPGFDCPKCSGA